MRALIKQQVSLIVADDEVAVLRMLDLMFATQYPWVRVVGHAINAREAIQQAKRKKPDALILDLMMPWSPRGLGRLTGAGVEAIPSIRKACPSTVIVAYSAVQSLLEDAMLRGADQAYDKLAWRAMLAWLEERFNVPGTP